MNDDQRRAERLRSALTTAADAHQPDPGAWDQIRARVEAGDEVAPPAPRSKQRVRVLAAAAAIAVLAAVGAAVLATRDTSGSHLATTPGGEEATGWYIPTGLPDGWSVASVTTSREDEACPCRTTVWTNEDRTRAVTAQFRDAVSQEGVTYGGEPSKMTTFSLGDGVEATRYAPTDLGTEYWDVSWTQDGRDHTISATGIPLDEAEPIARAVYADRTIRTLPVSGLAIRDEWVEDGDTGRAAQVEVMMKAPSGNPVPYTLSGPESAVPFAWTYDPTDRVPDQPLPLLVDRPSPIDAPEWAPDVPETHDYLGRWPGAAVRSSGFRYSSESGEMVPTDPEVEALMASLRPATAEQWRAFVATAGNRDRAATASATLADLIDQRTTAPAAVTTTTTTSTSSTDPGTAPGLAQLELSLTAEPQLAGWEDAGVVLHIANPTGTAISDPSCALDHAQVGLFPSSDATRTQVEEIADLQWWSDDGPCDGGVTIEPGATKVIRLVVRAQFLDARYGPLPAGTYSAVARVEGVGAATSDPIEVKDEACPSGAEDYLGLTESEAYALGGERVMRQVRVLTDAGPDSDVADLDCFRMNLILGDDGRVVFARAY